MIRAQKNRFNDFRAMEVSENGMYQLENPRKNGKRNGRHTMDLVASAENIIVAMMHVNKAGESKILKKMYASFNRCWVCEKSRYRN